MSLYERFKNLIAYTGYKIRWTNLDKNGNLRVCLNCNGKEIVADVVEDAEGDIVCK